MRRTHHAKGFTLLELLAVVGLLGIILFFVIPNVDSMTPGARLKSSARGIASSIELAQGQAIATGKEYTLAYDLSKGSYWIILPPPEPEPKPLNPEDKPPPLPDVEHGKFPEVSSEKTGSGTSSGAASTPKKTPTSYMGRDIIEENFVPADVEIQSVTLQSGRETSSGIVYVPFSSLGNEGSHAIMVRLRGANGRPSNEAPICVRFNALTRTVDFGNEKLGWEQLSGQ
jgi:prepilin-type N-terminal cleavage/methylation domain-containing protein